MADISKEIQDFRDAVYGEEVRGSMISLAEKINKESGDAVEAAEGYRDSAKAYSITASALCEATTKSADQASAKAAEALESAESARESETKAGGYAAAAKESEEAAGLSEGNAEAARKYVEDNIHIAEEKAAEASASAEAAAGSEAVASAKAGEASASALAAKESEGKAEDSANKSKSYAVGTGDEYREGDATDNSKFYKEEAQKILKQAMTLLESVSSGGLVPAGTIAFADLPVSPQTGYMYNISNAFVTDERFSDGAGLHYNAGANVYWTADGKWDVLTGVQVTGVKGSAESVYRTGEVNITKGNIGLGDVENKSSATIRGELTKANVTNALGYTPPTADTNTWKANTKDNEGYAAKGSGQANKVWKTDANGNPGWRDDANTIYTHPTTAGNAHIPAGGAANQVLMWLKDGFAKWANLGAAAFASLANNLSTTEPGFAMDARMGPVIDTRFVDMETQIAELNSALESTKLTENGSIIFILKAKRFYIFYIAFTPNIPAGSKVCVGNINNISGDSGLFVIGDSSGGNYWTCRLETEDGNVYLHNLSSSDVSAGWYKASGVLGVEWY